MKPKYLTDPLLLKVKFDINAKYSEYFNGSTLNYDGLIKDIRSIRIAINTNKLYYGDVTPSYWGWSYKGLMTSPHKNLAEFITKYYKDFGEDSLINLFSPNLKNKPYKINICIAEGKSLIHKDNPIKKLTPTVYKPIKRFLLEDFLKYRHVDN